MKELRWIVQVLLAVAATLAHAQKLDTRHFTNEEGLLENTPIALLQDHKGRLWVGTRGGACRYDGQRFQSLPPAAGAADRSVAALAEAPDGTMWFGHFHGGLSWWSDNGTTGTYWPKGWNEATWVSSLYFSDAHTLWIGTSRGLYRCHPGTADTAVTHVAGVPGSVYFPVATLCQWRPGQLLAATSAGLAVIDVRNGRALPAGLPPLLTSSPCLSVRRVSDTLFWVTGPQMGLMRLSRPASTTGWQARRYTEAQGLCAGSVLNALQDRRGRVWVLTSAGLSRLDPAGHFTCFPYEGLGPVLPAVLLEDREGNIWSGHGMDGIRQYAADERFAYFSGDGKLNGGVTAVLEAQPGTYWLATHQGAYVFRPDAPASRQLQALPLVRGASAGPMTSDQAVYSFYRDAQGRLWQGSDNGVARFDFATQRWQTFDNVPGLAHAMVMSIAEDRRGRVWFSTQVQGVTRYDPATGQFHSFGKDEAGGPGTLDCYKVLRDKQGELWLGTERNGLLHLDLATDTFRKVPGSEQFTGLVGMASDPRGGLWLVSLHTGLIHFDGHRLRAYNHRPGLSSTSVTSAIADSSGRVWVGTSQGLDSFDPRTGQVATYGVQEGFLGHGAFYGSSIIDRAGRLWVGTQQGVMCHDPRRARPNRVPPTPVLTGLRLFLQDTLARPGLTLPHHLNQLTFDYVGVSLTNPERVRYRYRLRGFDQRWQGPVAAASATYTNLPPGSYTFEVNAANNDGVWSTQPATFAFTIESPWWRTWWAYGLYALAIALALYRLRSYILNRERLRNDLQIQQLALGHLQELDKVKTTFFTNISHEFRTPLTLILGPAEDLLTDSTDPATRHSSGLILRNAQRLLRLINQLLDLSKLDAGAMQLTPLPGDLASLARLQAATFASLAEARRIHFHTEGPAELPLVFDAAKLEIILTNLLSNAIRFTPDGGEVTLSWHPLPTGGAELTVRDTGPGIAPEQLPRLFDRFYQGAHPSTPGAQPGTGVGLTLVRELVELHGGTVAVSSEPGHGATFTVRLPAGLVPVSAAGTGPTPETGRATLEQVIPEELLRAAEAIPDPEAELVLFIEDNADVREFIRSSLAPAGYRLLDAPNGLAGVDLALAQVPDLVISDVMMPGLDGYGVVRQLKTHPATSHIPLVLLTAKSADTDRLEGLEIGADAYLGKPFAARELRAQVRNLLALRARTRAHTRQALHLPTVAPAPLPQAIEEVAEQAAAPTTEALPEPLPAPIALSAIDQRFLDKVAAAVGENLADSDFDVDQLSAAVALSRTQLQRKLRALTGQSPAEHIRTARLQTALVLLRARAGTVAEVCYQVGFSSPAHFSTAFSRQFGYPPSDVARQ